MNTQAAHRDAPSVAFVRLPEVLRRLAVGRSTLLRRVAAGLFPPPVRLGVNCVAWAEHETAAVAAALLAGRGEAELRELVAELVARRGSGSK